MRGVRRDLERIKREFNDKENTNRVGMLSATSGGITKAELFKIWAVSLAKDSESMLAELSTLKKEMAGLKEEKCFVTSACRRQT